MSKNYYNRFIPTDVDKLLAQGKIKVEQRTSELSIRLNFFCAYHQVLMMRVTAIYLFVLSAFYCSPEIKEAYGNMQTALIVGSVLSSIDLVQLLYGFVNKSLLTITPSELRLRFSPLPMRGALKLPSREIAKVVVADRHLSYATKSGGSVQSTYYILSVVDKQGTAHKLITTKYATGEVFSLNYIAEKMANFLQVPCKIFNMG